MQLTIQLKADGSGLNGTVRVSRAELDGLAKSADGVAAAGRRTSASLATVDAAAARTRGSVRSLVSEVSTLRGTLATLGIAVLGREFLTAGQDLNRYRTTLAAATGSHQAAAREMAFLRGEAERLGIYLPSLIQGYTGLTAATRGTNLEGEKTRNVFLGIAEGARAMNLTAENTAGVLTAVQQIAGKGVVSMEELRLQLGDRLPGAMQIAARSMNMTVGEFMELVASGELLSEDFLPRFAAEMRRSAAAGVEFSRTSPAADFERLKTALFDFASTGSSGAVLEALASGARSLTEALREATESGAVELLGEGLGLIVSQLDTLLVAVTAYYGLRLGAYFRREAADVLQAVAAKSALVEMDRLAAAAAVSSAQARAADIAQTLRVVELARAEVVAKQALARAELESAQRTLAATQNMMTLSSTLRARRDATEAVTAAQLRLNAVTNELATLGRQQVAMQGQLAAAATAQVAAQANMQNALTKTGVAMAGLQRVGAGLFALLGGWPGIVIAGVAATYALIDAMDQEREERLRAVKSIEEMNAQMQREYELRQLVAQGKASDAGAEFALGLQKQVEAIAELNAQLAPLAEHMRTVAEVAIAAAPILEELERRQSALAEQAFQMVRAGREIPPMYREMAEEARRYGEAAATAASFVANLLSSGPGPNNAAAGAEVESELSQIAVTGGLTDAQLKLVESLEKRTAAMGKTQVQLLEMERAEQLLTARTAEQRQEIEAAYGPLIAATQAQEALTDANARALRAGEQLVQNLRDQVATFGLSEDAAIAYRIAQSKLTASQRAEAQGLAAALKAQREHAQAVRLSEQATKDLQAVLRGQSAFLGGPAVGAFQAYEAELEKILEIEANLSALGPLTLEQQQAITDARTGAAAAYQKDLQDIADQADESKQRVQEILDVLGESPFEAMKQDLADLGNRLQEELARGGPEVEKLKRALGEVRHAMNVAMITSTQEGLRSLQSMTANGSKAFAAFQVAIDALSVAQAISAVLNQGQGDPYTAFARMAAMAAAVASLVGNIGANFGGGFTDTAAIRQERQGTGTVLGDSTAKSESILRATEITADATSELVPLQRGMLQALIALQGGIDRAGGLLARGAGTVEFEWPRDTELNEVGWGRFLSRLGDPIFGTGFLGRFLGGSSQVTDSGIILSGGVGNISAQAYQEQQYRSWRFGSRRTREQTSPLAGELEDQFELVIDSLVNAVREGALALGLLPSEIEDALERFRLEEIRISLKDLSAEEQQAELLAVFSSIFDGLAGEVVPFIAQFQRVGEGLGETLVRVATGVQVTQEALGRLGFALESTGPEQFAQISESLIELAGGIEAFIEGMTGFIDAFAPEAHKFELLQSDLNRAFAQAGLSLPATRDGMWQLMQSLDATTESGREQIATLLRLSDTADEYYGMLEDAREREIEAIEAQIEAIYEYEDIVQGLRDELSEAGMSQFAIALRDVARWTEDTTAELHAAARAAGLQGAAESDLAAMHQVAALRAAAAIRQLREAAGDLVEELYGSPLDQINAQIAEIEAAQQGAYQGQIDGLNAVGEAGRDVYAAQLSALQNIQQWLDSQLLGDTSTLTPEERIAEARRQFEALLPAAQAGDVEALQRITQLGDTLLREGRSFWASGEPFTELEAFVRGALQGLVNAGPTASPITGEPGGPGGPGYVSPDLQALYEERDRLLAQQENERRAEMIAELSQMIREWIQATGEPLEEIAARINLNLTQLAEDLGINLEQLTVETAAGLVDMARQLGVDVAELATAVGVSLGDLADRQSLLNQALDQTLQSIPEEFRQQLLGPLEAIRNATTEADATSALEQLRQVSLAFPAGIRDLLAPYFEEIGPTQVVTELGTLRTISDVAQQQLDVLRAILFTLAPEVSGTAPLAPGSTRPGGGAVPVPPDLGGGGGGSGVIGAGGALITSDGGVVGELRALRGEAQSQTQALLDRLARVEETQRDTAEELASLQRRTLDKLGAHR